MHRWIVFILAAASILPFTGCKKDKRGGNIYLLSSTNYTDNSSNLTDFYTYDSQNRLIQLYSAQIAETFKYTYDDKNNLATVETYNSNNQLLGTDKYTYAANIITATHNNPTPGVIGSYTFTLNNLGQVIRLDFWDQYNIYTYDSKGNIATLTSFLSGGAQVYSDNYTYDNNPNPWSMMGAPNLHLRYLTNNGNVGGVNNISRDSLYAGVTGYVYNAKGLPTYSSTPTSYYGNAVVNYKYLVK